MVSYLNSMEIKIIPVVNAIIVKNNKILLGKRSHESKFLPGYWTTPGGKVEPGEKLLDALKRELKEETNLEVKKAQLLKISEQFHDDHHHIIFDFMVETRNAIPKHGSDLVELSWFDKDDIEKLKIAEVDKEFLININLTGKNEVSIDL